MQMFPWGGREGGSKKPIQNLKNKGEYSCIYFLSLEALEIGGSTPPSCDTQLGEGVDGSVNKVLSYSGS